MAQKVSFHLNDNQSALYNELLKDFDKFNQNKSEILMKGVYFYLKALKNPEVMKALDEMKKAQEKIDNLI